MEDNVPMIRSVSYDSRVSNPGGNELQAGGSVACNMHYGSTIEYFAVILLCLQPLLEGNTIAWT